MLRAELARIFSANVSNVRMFGAKRPPEGVVMS